MSTVKLVAVFAKNQTGQLAQVTQVLADAGINIRCVTIATSESFGVIRFLVDQCDLAFKRLLEQKITCSLIEVLAVEVNDQPGGLNKVAGCLARHNINVQNSSGFVSNKRAVLIMEVKDIPQARAALEQDGFRLLAQEEVLTL